MPSKLVELVHKLEDEYPKDGKVSFLYVPDDEYRKFVQKRKELEHKQAKQKTNHWISYCRSKPYRKAMNEFLAKTQTSIYTIEELTDMIDRDPVLSDHGRHIHEQNGVYALLNQHGMKWRKSHASDHHTQ